MKLELKHLAPYLPYLLEGEYILSDVIPLPRGQLNETRDKILTTDSCTFFLKYCKPKLRPLSELVNEIKVKSKIYNELLLSYYDDLHVETEEEKTRFYNCCTVIEEGAPYDCIRTLLSHHFDVFGLIDKGLAIDINIIN